MSLDNSRYTVTCSKYTGEKNIRQNVINTDGTLSISVDALKIEQIRGQIGDVQGICECYENEIGDLQAQIVQVKEKVVNLREKSANFENKRRDLQNLQNKKRLLQNKLEGMKRNVQSEEEIQANTRGEIQNVVSRLVNTQSAIRGNYTIFLEKIKKYRMENLLLTVARTEIDYLTNSYREKQRDIQTLEETLQQLRLAYRDIKNELNEKLQNALNLSDNTTRDQVAFNKFQQSYDELSANVDELEAEKEELQSRIDCLQAANHNEVEEYEMRQNQITKLQRDLEQARNDLKNVVELLNTSQEQWLNPLQQIIERINEKFGAAFERMGCAGEVTISKGADERDYEQYGLSVQVSYRDGEPLQELNTTVQSGGERAVATAAFMLSLQELTPVPFRCVDEINQGMDAPNERRIFDLLMESTSQLNTAQYFLITPKVGCVKWLVVIFYFILFFFSWCLD